MNILSINPTNEISIAVVFLSGLFSFASPCVIPLIPSYLSYVTGMSLDELSSKQTKTRLSSVKYSLFFIFGFISVFVLMGVLSGTVGFVLHSIWFMRISGIFIILMGLFILGTFNKLKFLSFLSRDFNYKFKTRPTGLAGSFLVGIVFASAWTPCVGPILAAVLFMAGTFHSATKGAILLFIYALGLAIPFFISSLSINFFFLAFRRFKSFIRITSILSGIILIAVGMLIFFNYFSYIISI